MEHLSIDNFIGKFFNMKCMELLESIPDSSVDLVVTSPPYNQKLNTYNKRASGMHKTNNFLLKQKDAYFDDLPEEEYQQQQIEVLNHLYRIIKPDGSIFYNHKNRIRESCVVTPWSWISKTKLKVRQEIIWDRGGSMTHNARMFPPSDEKIFWLYKDSFRWYKVKSYMSVWKMTPNRNTGHVAPFPEDLPARCVNATTQIGDVVFDPYSGSGTVCYVAAKMQRRWFGCDINPDYCSSSTKRIAELDSQLNLL